MPGMPGGAGSVSERALRVSKLAGALTRTSDQASADSSGTSPLDSRVGSLVAPGRGAGLLERPPAAGRGTGQSRPAPARTRAYRLIAHGSGLDGATDGTHCNGEYQMTSNKLGLLT